MKKFTTIAITLALMLTFASCGKSEEKTPAETVPDTLYTFPVEEDPEEGIDHAEAYAPPAEAVEIDMTLDDPSNDDITFEYNEDGSVNCYDYNVNGIKVKVVLTYNEGYINVMALTRKGNVLASEEIETTQTYDPEKGFTSVNGFYVKGFDFNT